jgi:hypothetical protein
MYFWYTKLGRKQLLHELRKLSKSSINLLPAIRQRKLDIKSRLSYRLLNKEPQNYGFQTSDKDALHCYNKKQY